MRRKLPGILGALLIITVTLAFLGIAEASFTFIGYANSDRVKVYSSPSTTDSVIEELKLGDFVKVVGKSPDEDFWEIQHKDKHGWVLVKYINPRI
ncbi:MAG TPA: SH3 domain-containing protein [Methylomusa anaerophila]|uniref:Bacterial SH3 domain protein n=1 Tax=Methylomusa anaerophila TaxID=1930071 RepID=A0A348AQ58_9FIRM|nr:SH3 domain-containing protein [Methylomusa anaerophila]BBB93206.1 bacterial SH3 domain protein [Methylomusa anaerophila]HML86962.1 SH3 domain-containing protein [Methylomusa anaerophila]